MKIQQGMATMLPPLVMLRLPAMLLRLVMLRLLATRLRLNHASLQPHLLTRHSLFCAMDCLRGLKLRTRASACAPVRLLCLRSRVPPRLRQRRSQLLT